MQPLFLSIHYRCYSNPAEALENNIFSTINFLEAVKEYHSRRRIVKFIHISTDEVYGDSDMGDGARPKGEKENLLPGNPYAASKVRRQHYSYRHELDLSRPHARAM